MKTGIKKIGCVSEDIMSETHPSLFYQKLKKLLHQPHRLPHGIKHLLVISAISALSGMLIIMLFCSTAGTELFEYRRSAIIDGELWRLITGHFTHWNKGHLFWDLLAYISAIFALSRLKKLYHVMMFTLFSSLFISCCLIICQPEMAVYRGLSGIDTALLAYFSIQLLQNGIRDKRGNSIKFATILLAGICIKVTFEFYCGTTIFVSSNGFIPMPSAHLAGIVSAIIFQIFTGSCAKYSKKRV